MANQREQQLGQWIGQVLNILPPELSVVSGDASFRRYFRFSQGEESIIAVDAPPEKENNASFCQIAALLKAHQINVPDFLQINLDEGFLLLSDLGDQLLLPVINSDNADNFYRKAIDIIIQLQLIPSGETVDLPSYDHEKLLFELSLFLTWFVDKHLNLTLTQSQQTIITEAFELLIERAELQEQRFTHRDFHSRNLMVVADEQLGVIDFQDAVVGPISYDLVSLLKDCYIEWPHEQQSKWVSYYYQQATKPKNNIPSLINKSLAEFVQDFDWMGLQRHLKVLGIFCRLNYRDNKPNYLADLPLTYRYVKQVTSRYPEFSQFNQLLDQLITPAFEAKS